MPVPQGFQNAKLQIEGGDTIQCAFNPESYRISKTNIWTYKPNQSKDYPKPEFGGGHADGLLGAPVARCLPQAPDQSVKDQANALMKAMHGNGEPPKFIRSVGAPHNYRRPRPCRSRSSTHCFTQMAIR